MVEIRDPWDSYIIRDAEKSSTDQWKRNLLHPSLPKGVFETPPERVNEEESAPKTKRRKKEDGTALRRFAHLRFKKDVGREESSERAELERGKKQRREQLEWWLSSINTPLLRV